jgi:hypothetical protein
MKFKRMAGMRTLCSLGDPNRFRAPTGQGGKTRPCEGSQAADEPRGQRRDRGRFVVESS